VGRRSGPGRRGRPPLAAVGPAAVHYGERYPELAVLRRFPAGTVVDGELVVLQDGRADLTALQRRHHLLHPERVRQASRHRPVRYLLFDLLYRQGQPCFAEPLAQRRAALAELVARAGEPTLVFSEGVVGPGRAFFDRVVAQGHEGVLAKLLTSAYRPGQRTGAWRKIKPVQEVACVIVGYTPGPRGLHGLLLAAARAGILEYVGELTRGFSAAQRTELAVTLERRRRQRSFVACPRPGRWVEPDLYCRVRCFGWTPRGQLRDAVFRGLIGDRQGRLPR